MRIILFTFLISLGLISCDKSYLEKPDDLLSKSEMVDVLANLYISQQAINQQVMQDHTLKVAENSLYIFREHNISYKNFESSFKYYYSRPTEYQKILDKVKAKLEEQYSEEEKKRQKENKTQLEEIN